MSEPVHIDDAIGRVMLLRKHWQSEWGRSRREALTQVRDGAIVTDADVKVDELYRALARGHNIRRDSQRMYQCDVCGNRWHRGKTNHADECLYAEAIEYVNNNPKEVEDQ